ncbi:MAG TPA: anhydro-N-acetylmuramic acid kinase [Methylophilaceae bacterium]|nr:anhydro-N-acetylmuramic acid kinase [Methylophilaceae bacterium]
MTGELYIGLMSGTSLDGVDAAIVEFGPDKPKLVHTHSLPYSPELRSQLLDLHTSRENELEQAAVTGNTLARLYAQTGLELLERAGLNATHIRAIGCHGQTIRHRPDLGFTLQIGNSALVAELTGIDVVADFRSRDVAAGGQGAPLVPAFHQAAFSHPQIVRTVVNIGGIANLSYMPVEGAVTGFDSGPGNMLLDAWIQRHQGKPFDDSGSWAGTGIVIPDLLQKLLTHPFFAEEPPKSTGRDLFNLPWLERYLEADYAAMDVQRTLLELTAQSIADAVRLYCADTEEIYLCGGGAYNALLVQRLQQLLHPVKIAPSDELGINATWVEAAAFAWLARQTIHMAPGNLPEVTGAAGPRILGALYSH